MLASSYTLETQRLILRPFTESDVASYAQIRAKPAVVRFLPGGTANTAQSTVVAERTVSHFRSLWENEQGYRPWAITEKETDRLMGHMGLRKLPELGDQTELLFLLDEDFWGQGFATEGALASLGFGFEVLKLDRIIALAMPQNVASTKVMERVGMKPAPSLIKAFGLDVVEYSLKSKEWRERDPS